MEFRVGCDLVILQITYRFDKQDIYRVIQNERRF